MNPRLTISVCTFQSGDFDVMLIDKETKEEVCFSGNQKITDEQLDIVNRLAPSCVWTTYYPSEQYKALQARYAKLEAAARDALKFLHIVDQGGGWNCDDDERAAVAIAKALRSVVDGGADE